MKQERLQHLKDVAFTNKTVGTKNPILITSAEAKQLVAVYETVQAKGDFYTEDELKETAIQFFYYWYGGKGIDTKLGFDDWWKEYKETIKP